MAPLGALLGTVGGHLRYDHHPLRPRNVPAFCLKVVLWSLSRGLKSVSAETEKQSNSCHNRASHGVKVRDDKDLEKDPKSARQFAQPHVGIP